MIFLAHQNRGCAACSLDNPIVKMADEEKQIKSQGKVSTSSKDSTRLAGGKCTRIQCKRLGIFHVVGVLLLLFVLRILLRDSVISKSRACSLFPLLLDKPRFPFPRRRMSIKEREELFL